MDLSRLRFGHGTSIFWRYSHDIIAKLPPLLEIYDPMNIKEHEMMAFATNLSNKKRIGRDPDLGGSYPSVSALLTATDETLSKLYEWQEAKLLEMGREQCRRFLDARRASGIDFHESVAFLLRKLKKYGSITENSFRSVLRRKETNKNYGFIKSIIPILEQIPYTGYMAIEESTTNNYYCFQGRFDAIVEIRGIPTLVDWKTVGADSCKNRQTDQNELYDMPLQVVAYIASVNADPKFKGMPNIQQGAIVLVFEDGRPAELIVLTPDLVEKYNKILAKRINGFWWKMMHPKAEEKDEYGNVNFIFAPKKH